MPVNIPHSLPARTTLEKENIFVMDEERAIHQDIRPLRVAILNLMPTKITTETQILRLLGNSPLQVDVTLINAVTHYSKNTSAEHLLQNYTSFARVRDQKFDGLIITGAPVETLPFEEVDYWPELRTIMDWADKNVFARLFICWGAQAGLYHYYGIPKKILVEKKFGVFQHYILQSNHKLLRGFDDVFYAPHSRHTEVQRADIMKIPDLHILAESDQAGVLIAASKDGRSVFVTGHVEYDPLTIKDEYERDLARGLSPRIPLNYFPADDPSRAPTVRWRGHAHLLFSNWLNYLVYQETPYDVHQIPGSGLFTDS